MTLFGSQWNSPTRTPKASGGGNFLTASAARVQSRTRRRLFGNPEPDLPILLGVRLSTALAIIFYLAGPTILGRTRSDAFLDEGKRCGIEFSALRRHE